MHYLYHADVRSLIYGKLNDLNVFITEYSLIHNSLIFSNYRKYITKYELHNYTDKFALDLNVKNIDWVESNPLTPAWEELIERCESYSLTYELIIASGSKHFYKYSPNAGAMISPRISVKENFVIQKLLSI